ncbi:MULTISPECIES: hypothetical protein [Acinetobacter]|uniref:hypothetical protein n=1 Tax=Acinetobacter TaxID=469 RepID=UPI0014448032|nr:MULTISPECIES: hypothetical protein [Acinetobacter]MDM1486777.1 hypothetical protein [Acinetobacter towneri]
MKQMTKIALLGASVLGMGALTACQTSNDLTDRQQTRMMKHHAVADSRFSPEQREQYRAKRAEHRAFRSQMQQACDNKAAGTKLQLKLGEKTVSGTCTMRFQPDRQSFKQQRQYMMKQHQAMHANMQRPQRGEVLTDAQRAEMTKQYDQRLAQRQAHQQAMRTACEGKTHGQKVQVKLGDQQLNGQCLVRFQPNQPIQPLKIKQSASR